jgi:hypothetical protein
VENLPGRADQPAACGVGAGPPASHTLGRPACDQAGHRQHQVLGRVAAPRSGDQPAKRPVTRRVQRQVRDVQPRVAAGQRGDKGV